MPIARSRTTGYWSARSSGVSCPPNTGCERRHAGSAIRLVGRWRVVGLAGCCPDVMVGAQRRGGADEVVTIAQLRAVLSILRVDPDQVGGRLDDTGLPAPDAERVLLVGLLHRVASSELRQVVTTTMDEAEAARAAAVSTC